MSMEIAFSHRPIRGISVGIFMSETRNLFITASFVNTKYDQFSRQKANRILRQRIHDVGNPRIKYLECIGMLQPKFDVVDFASNFRKKFKPDPFESDDIFNRIDQYGGVTIRMEITRDETWNKILKFAQETYNELHGNS